MLSLPPAIGGQVRVLVESSSRSLVLVWVHPARRSASASSGGAEQLADGWVPCPTKEKVLATAYDDRWVVWEDKGCASGCQLDLGTDGTATRD